MSPLLDALMLLAILAAGLFLVVLVWPTSERDAVRSRAKRGRA